MSQKIFEQISSRTEWGSAKSHDCDGIGKTKILIADEATSSLDTIIKKEIINLIVKLKSELNCFNNCNT